MNDQGKLTGGTALLILASIALAGTGAALAPEHSWPIWLLIAGWITMFTALNTVYGTIRRKVREREIRDEERAKASHTGRQGRDTS